MNLSNKERNAGGIMKLKLTYVTGRSEVLECDEYEIFKKNLWYKKGFNESLWPLANILKIGRCNI